MRLEVVEGTLRLLATLINDNRFDDLETDTLEFKSVPATGNDWHKLHESACAFLNTRGGIIILGVKEEGTGQSRCYRFTGWQSHAEPNVRQLSKQFTDENGRRLQIDE